MDTKIKSLSFFKIVCLLILILALALISWIVYDFHYRKSNAILNAVNLNVDMITRLHSGQEQNREKIEMLQASLQNSNNWKLREVTGLIIQADTQLRTARNRDQALYFLTTAKTLLDTTNLTQTASLSGTLNPVIAQLKQLKTTPLIQINQTLIQAQQSLPNLIFTVRPNLLPDEKIAISTDKTGPSAWFNAFLNKFKNFIIIRKTDTPLLPLLSEDMKALAEQHLSALLTQAQFAALAGQNEIYQEDLKQVSWLVEHYYDLNNEHTKGFIANLNELQKINVQPAFPDLAPVLNLFMAATEKTAKTGTL
jgi:uroporphyrin-3 C-methyltransferase